MASEASMIIDGLNWLTFVEIDEFLQDEEGIAQLHEMNEQLSQMNLGQSWFENETSENKMKLLQISQICFLDKNEGKDQDMKKIKEIRKLKGELKRQNDELKKQIANQEESIELLKDDIENMKSDFYALKFKKAQELVKLIEDRQKNLQYKDTEKPQYFHRPSPHHQTHKVSARNVLLQKGKVPKESDQIFPKQGKSGKQGKQKNSKKDKIIYSPIQVQLHNQRMERIAKRGSSNNSSLSQEFNLEKSKEKFMKNDYRIKNKSRNLNSNLFKYSPYTEDNIYMEVKEKKKQNFFTNK